jgi:carbon storage regulator CsrA
MIGDEVEVHVVDIGGGKVRLGITSPSWITVQQRERYEARRRDRRQHVGAGADSILAK